MRPIRSLQLLLCSFVLASLAWFAPLQTFATTAATGTGTGETPHPSTLLATLHTPAATNTPGTAPHPSTPTPSHSESRIDADLQPYASVSGYLRDADNGETLLGANVIVMESARGATTNHAGYYIINRIPAGTWTLRFSYLGYRTEELEITLAEGEALRLDLELVPAGLEMDEVVIEARSGQAEQRGIGAATVSVDFIRSVPSVLQADVFRSVQLLPGVAAASDFSSGLYIRGGGPDQTLIRLDRTTVYNPSHFFGFFSTFNPDAIKDVQLYKGGYPARYGGRLGSVLDIYNKDGNRNRTAGSVSLGMLSSRAMIEGPYPGGSYMLAVRRSMLEPLLAALRGSIDNVPQAFYFYDINAKVNYDQWQNNRLSLSFYTGTDDVRFPFAQDSDFNLYYGNRTLSLDWTHLLSSQTFTNTTLTVSEYFNDPLFQFGGTDFERRNRIYDFSVQSDLEWFPSREHHLMAGLQGGHKLFTLTDRFDGQVIQDERINATYLSLYLQHLWRPVDRLEINAGLRANYFGSGNYLRAEPRLNLAWELTPSNTLQAAYGRYHQFLTLLTNEAISAFDLWLIADQGVPPAWGDQFVLGLKNSSLASWNLEIELYHRTMRDLFEFDPFLQDPAGLSYPDLFRFGEGYASGFEVFLERTRGTLTGFIGYTWGLTRRKFDGFNDNRFYPPKYDRTHDVNLVSTLRLSRRWSASAVFSYATGQAYTEPLGRTALTNNPFNQELVNAIVVGRVNASRLPAYHRLDVGFSRKGTFAGIGDSEWQFQLINVYSRRNVWFYFYDFDDNPANRINVRMLPIIPAISYTVSF